MPVQEYCFVLEQFLDDFSKYQMISEMHTRLVAESACYYKIFWRVIAAVFPWNNMIKSCFVLNGASFDTNYFNLKLTVVTSVHLLV